jgi:hypothetical protein
MRSTLEVGCRDRVVVGSKIDLLGLSGVFPSPQCELVVPDLECSSLKCMGKVPNNLVLIFRRVGDEPLPPAPGAIASIFSTMVVSGLRRARWRMRKRRRRQWLYMYARIEPCALEAVTCPRPSYRTLSQIGAAWRALEILVLSTR